MAEGSTLAVAGALAAAVSCMGTALVRRYAVARAIVDVPNHRSSHTKPTPRGGGVGMLGGLLIGALLLIATGILPVRDAVGILGGAGMVALIGWVDDRRSVAAKHRALVHAAAAVWTLYWIGGFPALALGGREVSLGMAGSAVALVTIIWCTNLYNFMDGIDGIAAGEAVVSGTFAALLLVGRGGDGPGSVSLLVAAAAAGFLVWNWAPARIFMGDVGSGTLGFLFAALAMAGERDVPGSALGFALIGAPFLLDSTLTLLRRLLRGERWYDAHRSHAYQRAVQSGFTHRQVSSAVMLLSCVMGALALLAAIKPQGQLAATGGGLLLVAFVYVWVESRHPMPTT